MTIFRSILFVVLFCGLLMSDRRAQKLGVPLAFGYMLLISAFRGNFTADYQSYVRIFEWFSNVEFKDFFSPTFEMYYTEKGYGLLNYIIGLFTDNHQVVFIVTSIIVLLPYYRYAEKSNHQFLFLLLFICFGPLFQSFNMMRQAVAASICCIAYENLKTGNFKKYVIWVAVAGTIHVSAFMMLPLYFLFRMKISARNLILQIGVISIAYLGFEQIMSYMDTLFFGGKYATYDVVFTQSAMSVVVPTAVTLFVFLCLRMQSHRANNIPNWKDNWMSDNEQVSMERAIAYNGTIYWFLTFLFAFRAYYCYRFGVYLCIFPMMAVIDSIDGMLLGANKRFVVTAIVVCLSSYYFLFGQYYGKYIFCF